MRPCRPCTGGPGPPPNVALERGPAHDCIFPRTQVQPDDLLSIVIDIQGRITYANPAYLQACGYSWEELGGMNSAKMVHPDTPMEASVDMVTTLRSGFPWTGIVKNLRKDGGHYWLRINLTAVRNKGVYAGALLVQSHCTPAEIAEV